MGLELLNPRRPSLLRGSVLVFFSLLTAARIAGFPQLRWSLWFLPCLVVALTGTVDTAFCMRKRWDWYHAGVVLLLYADLMVLVLLVAMLAFPLLMNK